MQDLFVVFKYFLVQISQMEYFIYVLASIAVCGICGLLTYFFRGER